MSGVAATSSAGAAPATGGLRQPRALVQANGVTVDGLLEVEFDQTALHDPGTFRATWVLGGLPTANNPAWWQTQTDVTIEIFVGFPSNPEPGSFTTGDLTSMFYGRADQIDTAWTKGTMTVTGRDLSAKLADVKTAQKYPNLTASQIATQLAAKYGLTPVVTATTTKVGKYYQIDHVDMHEERTDWDVLTWLAREEQFVVFVRAKELHFEPKPDPAKATAYPVTSKQSTTSAPGSATMVDVSTTRVLTVAKDIVVTVKSWNAKQKKGFIKTAKKGGGKDPQNYSYTIAGLTPDQAQQRANQILLELSQHEMKLSLSGPADNTLTVDMVIKLTGTGTAADQGYFPETINRTYEVGEGYSWKVDAKNSAPGSEPTL